MNSRKILSIIGGAITGSVLLLALYIIMVVAGELPSFEQLENPPQDLATRVMSSDGEVLDMFFVKRRTYVAFDSIPPDFVNALIATEDREFYHHWGIHTMRIVKAMVKNIVSLRAREGASTITQQLARNLFLNREISISRKLKEAITAVKLEQTYTKKEILELYANTVYFGRGAYGIQVASQVYFGKNPMELNTADCAYLVAVLKGPEIYNAIGNYEAALNRRNLVLNMMADNGFLEEDTYYKSLKQPIELLAKQNKNVNLNGIAPHFVEMVRQKLDKDERYNMKGYNLYRDGLIIHTTLNAKMQRYANQAVDEHLKEFQKQFNQSWSWKDKGNLLNSVLRQAVKEKPEYIQTKDPAQREQIMREALKNQKFTDSVRRRVTTIQTGVSVLDPANGHILAMVGGSPESMRGGSETRYALNHATQIRRQPGSSFKPFVYASALRRGATPETLIESGPFTYTLPGGQVWSPGGSSDKGGPVSMATGLKFSINTVAARLITEYTSPAEVIALAKKMGINSPLDPYPTIALGAEEVIPLEITSAYGAFLNQGISVEPVIITKIEDRMGNILYERKGQGKLTDALSPNEARTMINMMQGVVNGGTASSIRTYYRYDAAGKTGTTNDFADAWFIGFTPQLVAGVWVGFDDQRIKFTGWYGQGGKAAAPIWGRLMGKVYADKTLGYRLTRFGFAGNATDSASAMPAGIPMENMLPEEPSTLPEQMNDQEEE
jgi:penicillin-binding protein 1A